MYCSKNPINRFDPDGRADGWATFRTICGYIVPGYSAYESFQSGDYGNGAIYGVSSFLDAGITVFSGALIKGATGGAEAMSVVTKTTASAPGKIVLGKYPDYINLANELNAKRFSIPTEIWNKMTKAEQWAANQKFLDRAIARGDEMILSNTVKKIEDVTGAFRQELDYLVSQGYHLSEDGLKMIK